MTERNQTTTPVEPAQKPTGTADDLGGKLPVDYDSVDDLGGTNITKGRSDEPKKATEGDAGAKEGEPSDKGADKEPTSPPAPKTFSEEYVKSQIKSIKDGHQGVVAKMRADLEAARKELDSIREQVEENQWASFLTTAKDSGVPDEFAEKFVERAKLLAKTERDYKGRLTQLEQREALISEAGKAKKAYDLITEYELEKGALEALLGAEDEKEMELKALKLRLEAIEAGTKPTEHLPTGQGAQPGLDWDKMSDSQKMGKALEMEEKRMKRG